MHVTARVFVGAVTIVALVLGTVFTVARTEARRAAAAGAVRALEQSADLVAQLLAGRGRSLAGGARVFVQGPYFRTLVAESRRDDILDQTFEAAEQLDASWVFITDASGMLVAKSDEPSASGDQLANVSLISGALRGQVMTGFGGSGDSALFQATAVPVAAPGGSPFGVLVATRLLDSALAVDIATATGSELVFYVRTADGVAHVAASTMTRDTSLREAVRSRASGQAPLVIDGREWITHATALNTAGGTEVGGYLVLRRAEVEVPAIAALRRAMAIASALGLLLAVVAALVAHRVVGAPAGRLEHERQVLARELSAARGDLQDHVALSRLLSPDVATLVTAEHPVATETSRSILPLRHRVERTLSLPRALPLPILSEADSDTTPFALGSTVAKRYRIDAILGERDRGVLYRALDLHRGELVALGVVRPERLFLDDDARALLAADVAKASRVVHPHVAQVRDVGDDHGVPFVASEFVPGVSLASVLRQWGTLPVDGVIALARQLLRALAAAHAEQVIHGDIKPSDIRIVAGGQVKLAGFGIARALRDAAQRAQSVQRAGDASLSGRVTGATVGTPEYLAPEQLIGASASFASDLYALGLVLHECLAGHAPQRHDMPVTLIGGRLGDEPGAHARSDAIAWPLPLDTLIASMTENDLANRAHSAADVLERLERLETSAAPRE
ncbi:protein kinase domain-containing protein [Gemmatimonas groenlandica]|uniref:Protein kinase n=1 Tax=Gemmatimonas groenlandica TaxID=2732249 RepID=A0A6M4IJK5_9BACT|nr:cache domain-containing protein [Gemmatimonas groenlandica]QJR35264.1 protein kinase [Gemmatimonas groenlandica]